MHKGHRLPFARASIASSGLTNSADLCSNPLEIWTDFHHIWRAGLVLFDTGQLSVGRCDLPVGGLFEFGDLIGADLMDHAA